MAFSNPLIDTNFPYQIRFNVFVFFLLILPPLAYITPCTEKCDSFLYFFSTNAQVLAAIIALIGTYLIFRINLIDLKLSGQVSHISTIIEKLTREMYSPLAVRRIILADLLKKIDDANKKKAVEQLFQEYEELKKTRKNTIDIAKFPIIYTFFVMFSSLLLIHFTPFFCNSFKGNLFFYLEGSMSLWSIIECAYLLNLVLRINPLS